MNEFLKVFILAKGKMIFFKSKFCLHGMQAD